MSCTGGSTPFPELAIAEGHNSSPPFTEGIRRCDTRKRVGKAAPQADRVRMRCMMREGGRVQHRVIRERRRRGRRRFRTAQMNEDTTMWTL